MCTEKIIIFLIISVGAALNPSQACGGGGRGGWEFDHPGAIFYFVP